MSDNYEDDISSYFTDQFNQSQNDPNYDSGIDLNYNPNSQGDGSIFAQDSASGNIFGGIGSAIGGIGSLLGGGSGIGTLAGLGMAGYGLLGGGGNAKQNTANGYYQDALNFYKQQAADANGYRNAAIGTLNGLPDFNAPYNAQSNAGNYNPTNLTAIEQAPVQTVNQDTASLAQRQKALLGLGEKAFSNDFTDGEKAQMANQQDAYLKSTNAARIRALQDYQSRNGGVGSQGAELITGLQSGQTANDTLAQQQRQMFADSQNAKMNALANYGNQAAGIQKDNEATGKTNADIINTWNNVIANRGQNVAATNNATQNQAALRNTQNNQQISNANASGMNAFNLEKYNAANSNKRALANAQQGFGAQNANLGNAYSAVGNMNANQAAGEDAKQSQYLNAGLNLLTKNNGGGIWG